MSPTNIVPAYILSDVNTIISNLKWDFYHEGEYARLTKLMNNTKLYKYGDSYAPYDWTCIVKNVDGTDVDGDTNYMVDGEFYLKKDLPMFISQKNPGDNITAYYCIDAKDSPTGFEFRPNSRKYVVCEYAKDDQLVSGVFGKPEISVEYTGVRTSSLNSKIVSVSYHPVYTNSMNWLSIYHDQYVCYDVAECGDSDTSFVLPAVYERDHNGSVTSFKYYQNNQMYRRNGPAEYWRCGPTTTLNWYSQNGVTIKTVKYENNTMNYSHLLEKVYDYLDLPDTNNTHGTSFYAMTEYKYNDSTNVLDKLLTKVSNSAYRYDIEQFMNGVKISSNYVNHKLPYNHVNVNHAAQAAWPPRE